MVVMRAVTVLTFSQHGEKVTCLVVWWGYVDDLAEECELHFQFVYI